MSVILLTRGALAQINLGGITGSVSDLTGAVVSGVSVTARNVATGVTFNGVSNDTGTYRISDLPIGVYSVRFSKSGFKTVEQTGVELRIGQVAELNETLGIGNASETVVVSDALPIMESERSVINFNVDADALVNLPLSVNGGRDITSFAYSLAPTTTGGNYAGHIAGSQDMTKNVIVDGTDASAGLEGFVQVVGMEAVKQFEVQTSGITAEAARTGGGDLIMELKSGTNTIHGSAYGFLANEALDANTWSNKYFLSKCAPGDATCAHKYKRPLDRFHDQGYSLGGPIWKNHTFIFGDWENYFQSQLVYQQNGTTVPTTAFLNGDFSALLSTPLSVINPCTGQPYVKGQIFDPYTARVINGTTCYSPFAGNVIPSANISQISAKVANIYKQYYQPTNSSLLNNYPAFSGIPSLTNQHLDLKFDHQITETERLTSSYNWWSLPRINGTNPWQTGSADGGPLGQGQKQRQVNRALRVQLTSTLSPSLLNFASVAYNENMAADQPDHSVDAASLGFSQTLGIKNMPVINFRDQSLGYGEPSIGSRFADGYVFSAMIFNDAVTWTHGLHTFKFGGDFIAKIVNSRTTGGQQTYNFSNQTMGPLDPKAQPFVGFAFANFLLGNVQSASNSAEFLLHGRRKLFSLYAQDDWRLRPNLTLNLGLRYEFNGRFHEKNGHWMNFDITAHNPNWGNIPGAYQFAESGSASFEKNQSYLQLGPHIGGVYQPYKKLVIRAAYGLFYVPLGINEFTGVPLSGSGGAVGYIATNNVLNPSQNAIAFNWDGGYPGQPVYKPRTSTLTDVSGGAVYVSPDQLKLGYTQNWNVGFQYAISNNAVFSVNYIENAGKRLHDPSLVGLDYPTLNTYLPLLQSGHVNDKVTDAASAAAAGVPYPYAGFSGYAYQAINPFPQLASAGQLPRFVGTPGGSSHYRALIAEIETNHWHNITTDFNYTLSRAEGNVSDGGAYQDGPGPAYSQNPYDAAQRVHDVLDYNMTHVLKGYLNYDLPFGRGQRFLSNSRALDYVVGGVTIGSKFSYNTGTPFAAIVSRNSYPGWIRVFANRDPNVSTGRKFKTLNLSNLSDPSGLYFNPTMFSDPPYGSFGNQPARYTALTNWGYAGEDMSIMKSFGFLGKQEHRIHGSLRFDVFNVFNRHHWGGPNTSISSPLFGHVTGVSGRRTGQLGVRFEF
ncbi:MAG TPA: TonB-dependent receptor [Acidisarcina sp.]|nr:TonB-dependent receptor [Acidisarcina sp.]